MAGENGLKNGPIENGPIQARSVKGFLWYDLWYDLLYHKLYHKSCKNLLKNDVRFSRFLHDLWYNLRYDSDMYVAPTQSHATPHSALSHNA